MSRRDTIAVLRFSRLDIVGVVLASIASMLVSCNSTTEPGPKGGKRNYIWTVDTLAYPGSAQTMMRRIWGANANAVWVVGHNDQNRGLMYKFDGRTWTPVQFTASDGGPISGAIDLRDIAGFGPSEVLTVGERLYTNDFPPPNFIDSSLIARYNGQLWSETRIGGRGLTAIWGSSANDIWVGGVDWNLCHFNGTIWIKQDLPIAPPQDSYCRIYGIGGSLSLGVFVLASSRPNASAITNYHVMRKKFEGWTVVDSSIGQSTWGDSRVWISPNGTLYSTGHGVYRWNETSWQKVLTTDSEQEEMFGNAEDNVFVTTYSSYVYHWNGHDWFRFDQFAGGGLRLTGGWTDGSVVFLVGYTVGAFPNKTIVVRGH